MNLQGILNQTFNKIILDKINISPKNKLHKKWGRFLKQTLRKSSEKTNHIDEETQIEEGNINTTKMPNRNENGKTFTMRKKL